RARAGFLLALLDRQRALRLAARVLVEPREQLRHPRLLRRAVTLRARDEISAEAEPRGDGERVALAGLAVTQPERGRERRGVELDGRIARARMCAGERLQRLEVSRGGHERAVGI